MWQRLPEATREAYRYRVRNMSQYDQWYDRLREVKAMKASSREIIGKRTRDALRQDDERPAKRLRMMKEVVESQQVGLLGDELFPMDMIRLLFMENLKLGAIYSLCSTNKRFAEICEGDTLWIILFMRDFLIDHPIDTIFKPYPNLMRRARHIMNGLGRKDLVDTKQPRIFAADTPGYMWMHNKDAPTVRTMRIKGLVSGFEWPHGSRLTRLLASWYGNRPIKSVDLNNGIYVPIQTSYAHGGVPRLTHWFKDIYVNTIRSAKDLAISFLMIHMVSKWLYERVDLYTRLANEAASPFYTAVNIEARQPATIATSLPLIEAPTEPASEKDVLVATNVREAKRKIDATHYPSLNYYSELLRSYEMAFKELPADNKPQTPTELVNLVHHIMVSDPALTFTPAFRKEHSVVAEKWDPILRVATNFGNTMMSMLLTEDFGVIDKGNGFAVTVQIYTMWTTPEEPPDPDAPEPFRASFGATHLIRVPPSHKRIGEFASQRVIDMFLNDSDRHSELQYTGSATPVAHLGVLQRYLDDLHK